MEELFRMILKNLFHSQQKILMKLKKTKKKKSKMNLNILILEKLKLKTFQEKKNYLQVI